MLSNKLKIIDLTNDKLKDSPDLTQHEINIIKNNLTT